MTREEMEALAAAMRVGTKPASLHHCHAKGCKVPCEPERLMCLRHWKMVPQPLQQAVWRSYRAGQCVDKEPSQAWCRAADKAINFVARSEGK